MKYMVLFEDYDDEDKFTWVLFWWGTNKREAVKAYNDCQKEHQFCQLLKVEPIKDNREDL